MFAWCVHPEKDSRKTLFTTEGQTESYDPAYEEHQEFWPVKLKLVVMINPNLNNLIGYNSNMAVSESKPAA